MDINGSCSLPILNLPYAQMKLQHTDDGAVKVFDAMRQKYLILTPEEYVRQQFTAWMRECLGYPQSLMGNEVSINLNGTRKRCDTVVFRPDGSPLMIVEYKAPEIKISQAVFDQIARYSIVLRAPFLTVSNGLSHFCCEFDYSSSSYRFFKTIPHYTQIKDYGNIQPV